LVTVALLKSQYDSRQDHVEMFQPFLLDTISALSRDDFTVEDLQQQFGVRHGLCLPTPALQILLTRAKRRGQVRREGGRFFRIATAIPESDVRRKRIAVDQEHALLATRLRDFAKKHLREIGTDEEAIALLLAFLEENQIAFLLDDPGAFELSPPPALPSKDAIIVARFLREVCLRDPALYGYLERMLEGFVLQNALLLKDIGAASAQFRDLTMFFDTVFMFSALGLCGSEAQRAALESIELCKTVGIRLGVFEITVDEMKRVLAVYEQKLGSSDGIRSLFPGNLTTYFVGRHYAPSDIKQVVSLLDRNIRELGFFIKRIPKHDPRYTLDEKKLAEKIAGPFDGPESPRVAHDVDCIAAVLTLRGDQASDNWERGKIGFATTTGKLVRNVEHWYRSEGGKSVPPAIHVLTLSSLAWLKRPAAAPSLKMHELVAMCSAVIRPPRKLWDAFIRHLRQLEEKGTLTTEESVAVVANELTQTLLIGIEEEHDEEQDVDATTLSEVVDRVKTDIRKDADARVSAVEASASQRVSHAETRVGQLEEAHRQTLLHVQGQASRRATLFANIAFVLMFAILVVGTTFGIVKGISPQQFLERIVAWTTLGLVTVFGVYRATAGGNLLQMRMSLRDYLYRRLLRRWLPSSTAQSELGP
jgi:hypothetical protein